MSRVRGKMTALVINDIDAGVGHFKQTQTTVNNQVRPFVPQRSCPFQASGICMNVCTAQECVLLPACIGGAARMVCMPHLETMLRYLTPVVL